jgi:enoyl-[acyl-carrier-protein] reductase (NADH)
LEVSTKHPVGRLEESEEVSEAVCFLLSDKSSFVTGSQYVVDGGYVTQ